MIDRATWRDLAVRAGGLVVIAGSVGACLWARALMLGAPHEPTLGEAALVLASFVLSITGLVMVLMGRRRTRHEIDVTPGLTRGPASSPPY